MKWLKILIYLVLCLAGIFLILLIMATIADFRPGKEENAQSSGRSPEMERSDVIFTVLSWNLGYFGLGKESDFFYDGGRMTRPEKDFYLQYSAQALEYLASSDRYDFYFFQEVDFKSRRSYNDDQLVRLTEVFSGKESVSAVNYRVGFVPMPLRNPMGAVNSGLVTFLSFHARENVRYAFPGGYKWPVGLFMLDRCFLLSRLALPGGKDLVLINTHNEAFDDGSQRRQQLAVLKELMISEFEEGNYVVTGGDWNQNPVGYIPGTFNNGDAARTISPGIEPDFFPEGWQWVFDPAVPTNRDVDRVYQKGKTPATIIDFFVVSPNISVENVHTTDLGFKWSDHQPVVMTFKVK
jgi:endonuclease/exonuclease/phosphatase family metal-dependent hydrolase